MGYSPVAFRDEVRLPSHREYCSMLSGYGDSSPFPASTGMSYQVADGAEPHRSSTPNGAKLFIVD